MLRQSRCMILKVSMWFILALIAIFEQSRRMILEVSMWIVGAVKSHDDFEEATRTLTSIIDGCFRFFPCLVRTKCKRLCAWRQMICQQSLSRGCINVPCPLVLFNWLWPSCKRGGRLLPGRLWPSVDQRCASTNWFLVVERVLGGSNYKSQRLDESNTVRALVSMLRLDF